MALASSRLAARSVTPHASDQLSPQPVRHRRREDREREPLSPGVAVKREPLPSPFVTSDAGTPISELLSRDPQLAQSARARQQVASRSCEDVKLNARKSD